MGHRRIGAWFGNYASALSQRDLRLLLGGLVVSATGSWAYNVALLALVFSRTHSLAWVGAAGLVRFAPSLLLSTYGGVIAERTERIRLMVRADLLCALWQVGLVVVAAGRLPVALALMFAALTSAKNVVYNPAVAATIPSVVTEDDLVAANALNGTIDNLVVIAGPGVGAVLLLLSSTSVVFGVNAASFLISAVMVDRIRARSRPVDVTDEGAPGRCGKWPSGCAQSSTCPPPGPGVLLRFGELCLRNRHGVVRRRLWTLARHRTRRIRISARRARNRRHLDGAGGRADLPIVAAGADHHPGSRRVHAADGTPDRDPQRRARIFAPDRARRLHARCRCDGDHSTPALRSRRAAGPGIRSVLRVRARRDLARRRGSPAGRVAFGLHAGLWTMALAPFLLGVLGYPSLLAMDRLSARKSAELAPKVAVLEQLGIFAAASHQILERLALAAAEAMFSPAATVIREGDPADALYVLVEGEVEVTAQGEDGGSDQFIRTMTAPSYFGEIGVLERIPRTATVTALTDCRCERIDGETLLDALITAPPSSSLMENARSRLLVTHPSRETTFTAPEPV